MKLLSLQQAFEYLATKDHQMIDDLMDCTADLIAIGGLGYIWSRQMRNISPVLLRLQRGETLSRSEARQLTKCLSWSAYFVGRSWRAGAESASKLYATSNRIVQESRKPSIPPPSSDKWRELSEMVKDLAQQASEIKAGMNNAPHSGYGA